MIEITKKEACHGCHGCFNVCPKACISMEIDNEGFWYPKVDKKICINCNLCEKVCPIINTPKREESNSLSYACKNKDESIRLDSSSGGIFTLLCEYVIKNDGIVFGAAFDKDFNVYHCYSETLEGCAKFRGSKYVQSIIGNTYKQVKNFLKEGKIVLFSGTPCQVSGLDTYLMQKYENLIMIDIACHGVPSPLVYRKYIDNIKNLNNSKIKNIQFREKSNGWKDYNFKVTFKNGSFIQKMTDNIYMKGFLQDLYLRPSCYSCEFKKPMTSADITLADYWGVQNIHRDFDDDKGVSLVLINSDKGKDVLNNISEKMDIIKTDYDFAINNNPSIITPANYNKKRGRLFKGIESNDIEKEIAKFIKVTMVERVIRKLQKIVEKLL
ncbi:Coenzyme F420 hydrogenase/dehydrogenase, beta subunit C-terminal domain [Clostridium sp. 1001271B_151109_B4]|uniref:Coenzyme F420 hydrogenase/dehydrogenase, beta subunit C-terminal domain n=1 Tax=Clostridium sp. 1001271B_151109_B4 TaxID=2787148 RepID=UPI0018ABF4F2|nr:Coenzyme F420 hydrogenase/dehydrogenase, beta subunit C-terminal domain [Clostridium sp. 1001271B_151109_B4]